MSSSRFTGKMLKTLNEIALVNYVYQRCLQANVEKVLVATSVDPSDDQLAAYGQEHDLNIFRGDLNNVLKRYINAARQSGIKYIVRVCGDTPLVDIGNIDFLIKSLVDKELDYCAFDRKTCASCFYCEAVSLNALEQAIASDATAEECEHVTKYIIDHPDEFKMELFDADLNPAFMHKIRLTVDYPQDLDNVQQVIEQLDDRLKFTSQEILNVIQNKELSLCP